jgi:hypothetical protein
LAKKRKIMQKILFVFIFSAFVILNNCFTQTISSGATFSGNSGNYVFGIIGNTFSISSKNLVFPGFSSEKINKNENSGLLNINTFPNPVSDILNVEISDFQKNETISIKIFDISGSLLLKKSFDIRNFDIDFSNFREGIYFLEFVNNNNIRSERMIKVLKIK